ncbi:MAG: hypothetical protein AMXMBFR25_09370 [Lysobacterales bacterium]|nr:hypothetical protein [Xanthomonadales bacterium]
MVCEVADTPLLLLRGEDGELRALHNVCRHRSGPLATARIAQWQGQVFVALSVDAPDFDEFIAGIDARLGDVDIRERVRRAFASGSYSVGRVHPRREQGVHWLQEWYRAALR